MQTHRCTHARTCVDTHAHTHAITCCQAHGCAHTHTISHVPQAGGRAHTATHVHGVTSPGPAESPQVGWGRGGRSSCPSPWHAGTGRGRDLPSRDIVVGLRQGLGLGPVGDAGARVHTHRPVPHMCKGNPVARTHSGLLGSPDAWDSSALGGDWGLAGGESWWRWDPDAPGGGPSSEPPLNGPCLTLPPPRRHSRPGATRTCARRAPRSRTSRTTSAMASSSCCCWRSSQVRAGHATRVCSYMHVSDPCMASTHLHMCERRRVMCMWGCAYTMCACAWVLECAEVSMRLCRQMCVYT